MTWRRSTRPAAAAPGVYLAQHLRPAEPAALQPHRAHACTSRRPGMPSRSRSRWSTRTSRSFRQLTYISAYGEGWALYCERLGQEMGMYETAVRPLRHARLPDLARGAPGGRYRHPRAGLDARAGASTTSAQYTALPEREIGTEIDRYIAWPGAGAVLLPGRARHPARAAPMPRRHWASASTSAPSTMRCCELGSVPLPVLTGAHRALHRRGGQGPLSRHGVAARCGVP